MTTGYATTVYAIYDYGIFREFVSVYSSEALAESAKCKMEWRATEIGYTTDYRIEPITMDEE